MFQTYCLLLSAYISIPLRLTIIFLRVFLRNVLLPMVLLLKPTYPSRPHSSLTISLLLPQCNPFFHTFVPQPFAFVSQLMHSFCIVVTHAHACFHWRMHCLRIEKVICVNLSQHLIQCP